MLWHLPIFEVLATFIGTMVNIVVATPQNERQQSVNYFGHCILYNPMAMLQLVPIIEVLAAFIDNMVNVDVATSKNEHQQCINDFSSFKYGNW